MVRSQADEEYDDEARTSFIANKAALIVPAGAVLIVVAYVASIIYMMREQKKFGDKILAQYNASFGISPGPLIDGIVRVQEPEAVEAVNNASSNESHSVEARPEVARRQTRRAKQEGDGASA